MRPGKAREAKLLWLAAPSGPIALLHIGLKRDVRHPAAAEQAAGALLWFVLAAAKRVRPPSALDAKLFFLTDSFQNWDRRRRTCMDRPGIEPGPSCMLSGCDATTPTAPELRRLRVLNYLLGTAFSAEALSRNFIFQMWR